jgi:hypothetical protein
LSGVLCIKSTYWMGEIIENFGLFISVPSENIIKINNIINVKKIFKTELYNIIFT